MTPRNPEFLDATRTALSGQPFAALLGLRVGEIREGIFDLTFTADARHLQHDGVVHGGVLATVADTCIAMAAHTLIATGERVLTIEFKINYLRPVLLGQDVRCRGEVVRPGRTITVTEAKIYSRTANGEERLNAIAFGTVATVAPSSN